MFWGVSGALSMMVMEADFGPTLPGLNVTLIVQLECGKTVEPFVHVVPEAMANAAAPAPVMATEVIFSEGEATTVSVTVLAALFVPTI
jgi:hypothetical protein